MLAFLLEWNEEVVELMVRDSENVVQKGFTLLVKVVIELDAVNGRRVRIY